MTITTVFDPPLPTDNPATFNSKAFILVGDLNDWSTEANALAVEINQDETALNNAVDTATTQAGIATTQASNALASANAAAASFDSFDDRYLGPKASNPTLDNDGAALLEGALYWNTTAKEMRAWNGTAWVTASVANAVSRSGDTMTGPLAQAAGTVALPSYTFSGDTNTGMWSPGADILAWSTAGTERLRINPSGARSAGSGLIASAPITGDDLINMNIGNLNIVSNTTVGYPAFGYNIASGNASNTWRFQGADNASWIQFEANKLRFFQNANAPTAGGLITARETLQIDGNGNVGIGVVPAYKVDVAVGSGDAIGQNLRGRPADGISVLRFADNANTETARIDVRTNAFLIRPAGTNPVLVDNGGGLGYGTGSGGTVTQATSKSTAVTLNKPSGRITMNAASLAAGASVVFDFSNSLITATDVVYASAYNPSVANAANYEVRAVGTNAAGSCAVFVKNISAGALAEALQINFVVVKGATS